MPLFGEPLYTTTAMAKYWEHLQPELIAWIVAQKLFWVATSPLSPDGRVNVSPKGVAGSFHVINEHKVWYEDLTGSGAYIRPIPHLQAEANGVVQESRRSLIYVRTAGSLSCLTRSTALHG